MAFKLNYQNTYELDLNGNTDVANVADANFKKIAAGISQVTPSGNETADTTEYYDGGGFGSDDITGKRLQLAFTGHRVNGDAAQDFIASLNLAIGDDLKTLLRWTQADGSQIIGVVTLTAIVASGGNAGAKQTFSFTAVFNGKPTFTAVIAVTGVTLDKTSASLVAGKTAQLTATIAPADASDTDVSYSTSDSSIATVSSTGLIKAIAAGTATITVTTNDGAKTATCAVTVTAA